MPYVRSSVATNSRNISTSTPFRWRNCPTLVFFPLYHSCEDSRRLNLTTWTSQSGFLIPLLTLIPTLQAFMIGPISDLRIHLYLAPANSPTRQLAKMSLCHLPYLTSAQYQL